MDFFFINWSHLESIIKNEKNVQIPSLDFIGIALTNHALSELFLMGVFFRYTERNI